MINEQQACKTPLDDLEQADEHKQTMKPTLSLLVIDLGDECYVRVEKGSMPHTSTDPFKDKGFYGKSSVVKCTFPELRKAIDGEKPIPRLERDIDEDGTHIRVMNNGPVTNFGEYAYKVLCEIAGQEIPIYDCGLWTRLTSPRQYGDDDTDIAIWRYRR